MRSCVAELISGGADGFYIGHPGGCYYRNTTTGDDSRMGITKTKPAQSYPTDNAALYFFEQVPGTENQVYAYCYAPDGVTKQYVCNGGNNSLSFTDEENKTAFTVTKNDDGTFLFSNGSWYWNMQGGATGARFCCYNNKGDANNRVNLWHFVEIDSDPYALDGVTCGLMHWVGGAAGRALMADSSAPNTLDAIALTVMSTSNNSNHLFAPSDSGISMWTFRWITEDLYTVTAEADGSTKYLKIDGTGLSLVSDPAEASEIRVVPGTGIHAGEISLFSDGIPLTFSGTVDGGFSVNGDVGAEWLHMVELSELTTDYFMTHSAKKVSVSDEGVTNGSSVIVYTREWNASKLKYDYYAINSDGALIPVYESGEVIPDRPTLRSLLEPWAVARNAVQKGVDWQFTTDDARTKIKHLYPTIKI